MLCVLMMKIRFRCRLRKYGVSGIIKNNIQTMNEHRLRHACWLLGLCFGLPVKALKKDKDDSPLKRRNTRKEIVIKPPVFTYHSIYEKRAIEKVLGPFFEDVVKVNLRIKLFRKHYLSIVKLQKEIIQKLQTRNAKTEVLCQYWEQVLSKMLKEAKKRANQEMIDFGSKIMKIRNELKVHVLGKFVS